MTNEKKYNKEELSKAIEEAFAAGFKAGLKDKSPLSVPNLSDLAIESLSKSLEGNAQKLNEDILKRHSEATKIHMQEWAKDKKKALDELLEFAETHEHADIKEKKSKK